MSNTLRDYLYRHRPVNRDDFVRYGLRVGLSATLQHSNSLVSGISHITGFVGQLAAEDPDLVQPVEKHLAALAQLHDLHMQATRALHNNQTPDLCLEDYLHRLYDYWYNFITAWNHLLITLEDRFNPFKDMKRS